MEVEKFGWRLVKREVGELLQNEEVGLNSVREGFARPVSVGVSKILLDVAEFCWWRGSIRFCYDHCLFVEIVNRSVPFCKLWKLVKKTVGGL